MTTKQAVILAAGLGTRLRPNTFKVPKCLLKVGQKRIIDYQLKSLLVNGFKDVVVVTGYKAGMVERYVTAKYPRLRVEFVKNNQYRLTGPAYSLSLARESLKKEFLVLVGDVVCSPLAVKKMWASKYATVVGASRRIEGKKDTGMLLGRSMKVRRLGKRLPLQSNYYEFMGMAKIGRSFGRKLSNHLQERSLLVGAIDETIDQTKSTIRAIDLAALDVREIDTVRDLQRANA